MTFVPVDHRRVQTAVIGDKHSDDPVILPMDHRELDRWRRLHPGYTYWCGIQLGGCGGELSDRRYTNKVCHFAHHPHAVCHRTANGESSADHLFIKRGLERLLRRQGLRGKVGLRDLGTGPGDAVDLVVPEARRRVRFQLLALGRAAWRRAVDELAEDSDGVDWVFAQDGPLAQEVLRRQGFSFRVRLETRGGERRVHIGTSAHGHPLRWTPLEECALTPTGLLTPPLETIRLSSAACTRTAGFPVHGGLLFAPVPGGRGARQAPLDVGDRQTLVAHVKPVDSPAVRAFVSLPAGTGVPLAGHVYRVPDGARVLVADDGMGWVVTAEQCIRLTTEEARRTDLWSAETAAAAEGTPTDASHRPANRERARDLISRLRPLEGALGEAVGKQVTRAINGAEMWLAAAAKKGGGTADEGGRHVRQLELALRAATRDLKLEQHRMRADEADE